MNKLLKHAKEKGTYFTCVTNDPHCRDFIKGLMPDFKCWAWIDHEPDTDNGSPHTHFIFQYNGSRTIQQVADRLEISPQYIQVVKRLTSFYRYMVHKDNPEKKQYSVDDIQTNHKQDFEIAINGYEKTDVNQLFTQFSSLSRGKITPLEFINSNYYDFEKMSFSQKIKIFEIINKVYHTVERVT